MTSSMGQIIKEFRKKNGFAQEELAKRCGITYQAVSKWENDTGMHDILHAVPLSSIFKVSTDVLFGIADTTENEGAWKIVQQADGMKKYGEIDTYLGAYDVLLDGLKKYPNNLFIMLNCMHLGPRFPRRRTGGYMQINGQKKLYWRQFVRQISL